MSLHAGPHGSALSSFLARRHGPRRNHGPVPRCIGFFESPAHGRNAHVEIVGNLTPGEPRLTHRLDAFYVEHDLPVVRRTRPTDFRGDLRDFGRRECVHFARGMTFSTY